MWIIRGIKTVERFNQLESIFNSLLFTIMVSIFGKFPTRSAGCVINMRIDGTYQAIAAHSWSPIRNPCVKIASLQYSREHFRAPHPRKSETSIGNIVGVRTWWNNVQPRGFSNINCNLLHNCRVSTRRGANQSYPTERPSSPFNMHCNTALTGG